MFVERMEALENHYKFKTELIKFLGLPTLTGQENIFRRRVYVCPFDCLSVRSTSLSVDILPHCRPI